MILGFRAGTDPSIGVAADGFAGTRRAWGLPAGQAPLGRVFPGGAVFTPSSATPGQVVGAVERACAPVLAAGMWPFWSLKPDPVAIAAGACRPHLEALARWAASVGVPVYATLWHEPENDPMGAAPADYAGRARNFVAGFTAAYRTMKAIAGDSLRMGPVYMAYQWSASSATTGGALAAAWRVPDGSRDFTGLDAYTSNGSWASAGQTLAVKSDVQRWMSALSVPPAEVLLVERGVSANYAGVRDPLAAQAVTLRADYDYLTAIGAHGMLVWNSGGASDNSVFLVGQPARGIVRAVAADAALRMMER